RGERRPIGHFVRLSSAASLLVMSAAAVSIALCRWFGAAPSALLAVEALAALALVAIWPMSWWWRRPHRLWPTTFPVQFAGEQFFAGAALVACAWLTVALVR